MSDLLRMTGMYSGMDTETIVSQLVKAKSTKVTNLKNEQKKLEWKQTMAGLKLQDLQYVQQDIVKLASDQCIQQEINCSSDSTKVTVVASEGAAKRNTDIEGK